MYHTLSQRLTDHFQHSRQFYFIITDRHGLIIHANPLFTKHTDFNSGPSFSVPDLVTANDIQKCHAGIRECNEKAGGTVVMELDHHYDGSHLSISWELSLLGSGNDEPSYIQWVGIKGEYRNTASGRWVSDEKERYEAYQNSAEGVWKFNLKKPVSISKSPEAIFIHCRENGYLADCNDNIARMYGFAKAGDMIGLSMNELMDLDDPQRMVNLAEFISNGFHLSNIGTKEYDRNGNVRYFVNNMTGIVENGMLKRIWGTQQDITEQKKAEEGLQQSELFYRNLIADSLDGMLLTDNKGIISFASDSVKKILGYEPEELPGKNAFEYMHPEDRHRGWAAFVNELEKAPVTKFINARILRKSGEWLWCMIRGHNMFDNPHVKAMLVYFCDDTLRMNTEMALVEGDKRFRQLINNLSLGVILLDGKGEMLICNQACFDIFKISADTLTGTNLFSHDWNITYENGSPMPATEYPVAVAMRTKKNVKDNVLGVYRDNFSCTWLLVNAEPVLDEQDQIRYIICSFQDITEQKRLSGQLIEQEIQKQKQLAQATIDAQEKERKEIGRELHDNISQHITTTRLYLEVAREKAAGEVLSLITQAHKGLQDTVNEMRQLSQSLVPPSLSDIGLVESVEDLCSPLKNTHAFRIEFFHHEFNETILPDNMKLMLFRIIQEQINNILRHAQATTIHIGLETIEGSIILSVSDNGKGFDPASIKRGLGFSNIGNRADLFGGTLKIDAAPGKGCSIRVLIPLPRSG